MKIVAIAGFVLASVVTTATAADPTTVAVKRLPPMTGPASMRLSVPKTLVFKPASDAAKRIVLKQKGLTAYDLPTNPPKVSVDKPIDQGLALSFYGVFAADAGLNFAETRDGKGFIALNWQGIPTAIYLVDCEVDATSSATIQVAVDGSPWQPVTVSGGHLLFAVPPQPDVPGAGPRAFAVRSPNSGFGFRSCALSKVK